MQGEKLSKFIITIYRGMELIQTGLSLDCLQELYIYIYIYIYLYEPSDSSGDFATVTLFIWAKEIIISWLQRLEATIFM